MIFTSHHHRSLKTLVNSLCPISARSLVTSRFLASNEPSDRSGEGTKKKEINKSSKSSIEIPKVADALAKFDIPNDIPEIPKKHVFQQITVIRQRDAVFTLEDAAKYVPSMFKYKSHKYPTATEQMGMIEYANRSYENEHTVVFQFPDLTDFLIVGSGLLGSAVAYYTKKMCSRIGDVVVIDKSPYSPNNCTTISTGLISAQSKSSDISRMATLSKELIRNLRQDILVSAEDVAQIGYRPVTHLILWPEREVDSVIEAVDMQFRDGVYIDAKLPQELEETWPWLSVRDSDVHLGTHGNQDEALVDPIGLRNVYRTLAQAHGAHFIEAEAVDFNMQYNIQTSGMHNLSAGAMLARVGGTGELRSVLYHKTFLALGHNTPFLESQAEMDDQMRDSIQDLHFIQPKLRLCFIFSSEAAPIINFPVITDVDGSMLIRDDYAGTFKYYITLEESAEFFEEENERFMDTESNEPFVTLYHRNAKFDNYFNNVIKPRLVKRIPLMNDARLIVTNSGFESYNTYDAGPIASLHPFHAKIMIGAGFGKRMAHFVPACAASISELLVLDEERTFDVTNFYWDRVMKGSRINEFRSLVA